VETDVTKAKVLSFFFHKCARLLCAPREEKSHAGEKIRASRCRTERILLQRAQQLKYSGVEAKGTLSARDASALLLARGFHFGVSRMCKMF
jgi:hypothetical protein